MKMSILGTKLSLFFVIRVRENCEGLNWIFTLLSFNELEKLLKKTWRLMN